MQNALLRIERLVEDRTVDVDTLRDRDGAAHAAVERREGALNRWGQHDRDGAAAFGDRDASKLSVGELVEHLEAACLEVACRHGPVSIHGWPRNWSDRDDHISLGEILTSAAVARRPLASRC